jgi:hypothetical protein
MNLLNIFRKKQLKSIGHYVEYLDDYPDAKFEMSIFRDDIVDLQIARQGFYKKYNNSFSDDKGYAILIAFTYQQNLAKCFEKFKASKLFETSRPLGLQKKNDRYIIGIERDHQKLFETIKFISEDIYGYDLSTDYQVSFYVIDEEGYGRLLSQYVGDNSLGKVVGKVHSEK